MNDNGSRVYIEVDKRQGYVKNADFLWEKMKDLRNPNIPMTHDGYLKLYQLYQPRLSNYDCILIDEAQDLTPAISDLLLCQPQAKILVGDPHEQIYSFRGAVNALQQIRASYIFYLTQSFRFGPEIAQVAACCIGELKHEKKTLVGNGNSCCVYGETSGQIAVLCRCNFTVFSEAANKCCYAGETNIRVAFVGGTDGFRFPMLQDLYTLMLSPEERIKRQSIQGLVQFSVDSKINTTGVYIEFIGLTYVNFKEKQKNGQHEEICYNSLENHCQNTTTLASKGGSDFCLSNGTYQYHFTTQLPEELPTSFECDGGYTRYYLRAYISLDTREELSSLLPVTVLTVFDLNESNYAMRSEQADDLQLVGCCSKKCVKTNLKITKSGYVPGERVQLEASCDNKTQIALNQAYINLIMNITLKTQKKDRLLQKIVRSWSVREIPPQTHLSLNDLQLTLPPLPPSGSRYCNNIDIHYTLQLTVELSSDVRCTSSVGLIVGNVPLESCTTHYAGNEDSNGTKVARQQLPNEMQNRLVNSAGVPTLKYDDTSCVLVGTYFRSRDKDGEWHQELLNSYQPVKWRPSYLFYVNGTNSDT